jgi:integrase
MDLDNLSLPFAKEEQEARRIYLVTDGCKSQQTKKVYRSVFNEFLQFLNGRNLDDLTNFKQGVIESKIISYLEYLRDARKLSYWTIMVHSCAILHFFEMNDISLNTKKIRRFLPENESYKVDRPYTLAEIQQILAKCDIRAKTIVLLMATTGMRVGALPGLKLSNLKHIDEFGLYLIWVYDSSRKDRYYTFCTPECSQAIDDYLAYRKRLGEQLDDSSPLIRNFISIDNPFTAKIARPIMIRSIQNIIERLVKEAGLLLKKREIALCHGFRKLYITTLDRAGVQYTTREYLAGHKLPGQDRHYLRLSEEDRLKEYSKAISALTFDKNIDLILQVDELEQERAKTISLMSEELKSLKTEIGFLKHLLPPNVDEFLKFQAQNKNIKLDARWVNKIPFPPERKGMG